MNVVLEEIVNQNFVTYYFKAYYCEKFNTDCFERCYTIFYVKKQVFSKLQYLVKDDGFEKYF